MRYILKSSLVAIDEDGYELRTEAAFCSAWSVENEEAARELLDQMSPLQDKLMEDRFEEDELEVYNPDDLGWGDSGEVININGKTIDYEAAVNMMDDDLREQLHNSQEWHSNQAFFAAYEIAYQEKYGEEWGLSKANPVW